MSAAEWHRRATLIGDRHLELMLSLDQMFGDYRHVSAKNSVLSSTTENSI